MPQRKKARPKGKAGPKGKRSAKAAGGRFWPDRVVGVLTAIGPVISLLMVSALAALGGANLDFTNLRRDLPNGAVSLLPLAGVLIAFLAIGGFLLWTAVRTAQGRKVGFIITATLAALGLLFVVFIARKARWNVPTVWQGSLLTYCVLRLIGWGPRPT